MKITDAILGEHGALKHQLLWIYKATEDGAALPPGWVEAQAEALSCLLKAHSEIETVLLFRFLPQDEPWVIHVLGEHDELDRLLAEARRGSKKCLRRVADVAWGHFDEEEKHVMPLALRLIPAAKLEALGSEWAKRRKVALSGAMRPVAAATAARPVQPPVAKAVVPRARSVAENPFKPAAPGSK